MNKVRKKQLRIGLYTTATTLKTKSYTYIRNHVCLPTHLLHYLFLILFIFLFSMTVKTGRLFLVDLAGSEKWNTKQNMQDDHISEMTNINLSLHIMELAF